MIAEIARPRIEEAGKLTVVAHQAIIPVLHRDDARHHVKKVFVFIPLSIDLGLLLGDLPGHQIHG
jgi:hypothetical protein